MYLEILFSVELLFKLNDISHFRLRILKKLSSFRHSFSVDSNDDLISSMFQNKQGQTKKKILKTINNSTLSIENKTKNTRNKSIIITL